MPILLKNHVGKGYPLNVSTELVEKITADGTLKFELIEGKENFDVISSISKMWTVTRVNGPKDKKEYRIVIIDRHQKGTKQAVSVIAVQKEIDDLKHKRVYENYTGTFTAATYFESIFKKTGYKYKLNVKPASSKWENAGDGETVLQMFQDGLERYGLEYNFNEETKTFELSPRFERKASYYISGDLNANAIKMEEDGTELCTYIRGYGGFEDGEDFREGALQMEFTHPLADVVGIREAEPIINQKITQEDTMKTYLENRINETIKSSLSLDFMVLKEHFPSAIAKPGDVVPIHSRILAIHESSRIVEVKTIRDKDNIVVKQDVMLGDAKRSERYQRKVNQAANMAGGFGGGNSAVKTIRSITNKVSTVSNVTKEVAKSAQSVSYSEDGIKTNSNKDTVLFGNGVVSSSNDGTKFNNVIDGNGIVSEALPIATDTTKGVITPEEKQKLNQITYDSVVITGNNKKLYSLTIVDGKLTVKELVK